MLRGFGRIICALLREAVALASKKIQSTKNFTADKATHLPLGCYRGQCTWRIVSYDLNESKECEDPKIPPRGYKDGE